jgi:small basic protein
MQGVQRFVKRALFVFGSFSFGWVLGIVLHELGHALAMWLTGGIVERITITPFSWPYTYYGSAPRYPQFTTWAGLLIGSALGLVVVFGVRKRTTPYLLPFLFAGLAPMLNGGGYYLVDTFVSKQGDATDLIRAGVPEYVVIGAGILFLAVGAGFVIRYAYRLGLTPREAFLERALLLASGVLPFFVLSLIYTSAVEPEDLMTGVLAIAIASFFVVLVAWASLKYANPDRAATEVEWVHALYAALLGLAAIVVPHVIFAG